MTESAPTLAPLVPWPEPQARGRRRKWPVLPLLLGCGAAYFAIGDALAPLAILLLWAVWHFLAVEEGPPVLAMALTFQWVQSAIGVFYHGLTGRTMEAIERSDYRPMVLMALGSVAALLLGLVLGLRRLRRPLGARPLRTFSNRGLFALYIAFLLGLGLLQTFAWRLPGITQGILALGFLRLVVLYLLFRRLTVPAVRWESLFPLVLFEVVLGFTGYFASFREPLVLLILGLIELFDRRRLLHWFLIGGTGAAVLLSGLLWLSIRTTYRKDFEIDSFAESRTARLGRVVDLSRGWLANDSSRLWENADGLVDRLWAIYYPALAIARVPQLLPHEDGRILLGAVRHVFTPRLFFPNKAPLLSDSEMVRKYSGLWVGGADEGTSIAFGYVAESYIDFGLPWMYLPMIAWGFLMGWAYRFLLRWIHYRELAVGLVTVVFWLALYLFERSWIKTIGTTLTLMIFMGGAVFVIDRLLLLRRSRWLRQRGIAPTVERLAALQPPGPAAPGFNPL